MAAPEGRTAIWARKTIAAALAAGAMASAAPVGIAMADPTYGPDNVENPAIADYLSRVNNAVNLFNGDAQSGRINQQQLLDQLTTANDQLQDALLATVPGR